MSKTHYKKLRNPNYIGSYELMTGGEPIELTVEIVTVTRDVVQNGDKKEDAMILHLKNQKPMIVNSTNAKQIEKVLGSPYVEDWAGKRITLQVKRIRAFGEFVDALRVSPVLPTVPTKEDINPQHERWAGALTALKSGKTTIEQIQKAFQVNDENLELLKSATDGSTTL